MAKISYEKRQARYLEYSMLFGALKPSFVCRACGAHESHFVPPMFREEGFFTCQIPRPRSPGEQQP